MTDLLVGRGDTFPRSFLDVYRSSKADAFYNDLTASRSDELVLQNSSDIPLVEDLHHGHSENLLDQSGGCASPTVDDFLDKREAFIPKSQRRKVAVYDRVDPEDSIRDIVTENDFYRFVLFKKHYDKYLHLSQKYEEARNTAYYLEEKYHEVKTERDDLIELRDRLTKKLESNESLLREKEDEVFVQFERVVYLEEQCDKLRAEKEKCLQEKEQIEIERDKALRILKEQATESEHNRRKLERARQEVVHHMTKIKNEKECLERENCKLKETLQAERNLGRYCPGKHYGLAKQRFGDISAAEDRSATLTSQFQKAVQHLATCKQKKCSVCAYTKATYRKMSPNHRKYNRKLFGCLQTPFLEMRNLIKPPPSPIQGEGESLSEWFCHLSTSMDQSECSSMSVPFAELSISYMDDVSDTSSNYTPEHKSIDQNQCSFKGFGSDSGFSSDAAEYKSNATTPKEKFCPAGTLDENDCDKLTRTKWTASFRKLINRIKK